MNTDILKALQSKTDSAFIKKSPNNKTSYFSEFSIDSSDFHLEIDKFGSVSLPINILDVEKLIKLSTPAKFGLREETILDKNVRDTYEISSQSIKTSANTKVFDEMLKNMAQKMGLPEAVSLSAHLHNMLIYQPGQFFRTHQDSEKLSNMVGTLVIVLPSAHIGGDLVISHKDKKHHFCSENINSKDLKCIAFYADCKHEVKQLKQGYRIALTYNLTIHSSAINVEKYENTHLNTALISYFSKKTSDLRKPLKFVYFLDHAYSEHGLRWDLLKGLDREYALMLRASAEKLDLVVSLALVEVYENWTTAYDDDDEEGEPEELLDDSTTLNYWVDINNKKLPYCNMYVEDSELSYSISTEELEPDQKEYEGWQGNYGNTVDFWYRRAAIVLWKKAEQNIFDFTLNYDASLQRVAELMQNPSNRQKVIDIILEVKELFTKFDEAKAADYFKTMCQISCFIQEEDLAFSILSKFRIKIIDTDKVHNLYRLQQCYGAPWCIKLLQKLSDSESEQRYYYNQSRLSPKVDLLMSSLVTKNIDLNIREFIFNFYFNEILQKDKHYTSYKPAALRRNLDKRMSRFTELLRGSFYFEGDDLLKKIAQYAVFNPLLYPELNLLDISTRLNAETDFKNKYPAVYDHFINHGKECISKQIMIGQRSSEDWSLTYPLPCSCNDCKVATTFLTSETETRKVWPIAQARRQHIIEVFKDLDLPVDISEERKGSPYKLILVKTNGLHKNASAHFKKVLDYSEKILH